MAAAAMGRRIIIIGGRIVAVRELWGKSDGFGGGMQIVSDKIRNFAVGSVPSGVGL